jgi:transposase
MAIQEATPIVLTAEERIKLEGWIRSSKTEQRLVARAKIVLLAAGGVASREIAREVGCGRGVVSKWRVRFARERLAGLADAPRSGKPKTYGASAARRILAVLDRPPPEGFARWTAPLIAKDLGDISDQHVWRFLRAQGIDLAGRRSWGLSTDPEFAEGRRHRRPLSRSAGPRDRAGGRREAGDPGARAGAGLPKRDRWLARHTNLHFHFTPTHASWLNQVEIWFSILARSTLQGASFTSVRQLREAIDAFIQAYHQHGAPFHWRKTKMRPKGLPSRITDL